MHAVGKGIRQGTRRANRIGQIIIGAPDREMNNKSLTSEMIGLIDPLYLYESSNLYIRTTNVNEEGRTLSRLLLGLSGFLLKWAILSRLPEVQRNS